MSKLIRSKRKRSAAQAMVEFGLALPILLLVMYGLIESGRLLLLYASVVTASRQAVRYGSVTGFNASGTPYYNDCAGIRATAQTFGFIQPFASSNIEIKYDNGPGAAVPWSQANCPIVSLSHPINGDRIYVRVSTLYSPIVPLVPFRPFVISSSGWRTLLVRVSIPVPVPPIILPPGTGGAMSMLKDAWCASCAPPGPYYESVGQAITYTYTIHNLGSDPILGISVVDNLAGNADCSGVPNPLNSGVTGQCTATYTITQADIDHASLTNTATATGVANSLPLTAQATKTINFSPKPKLALTKTGTVRKYASAGQPIDYTFTFQNTGNVLLTGQYTINDPNLDWLDCSSAVSPLALGASTTCTGSHILTNNDINRMYVTNTATATAMYGAYIVTSNSASTTVPVPGLLLVMNSCNAAPCGNPATATVTALGQTVIYSYTVTNRTSTWKFGVDVYDSRGANNYPCAASLAPLASYTCTRTYTGYTQTDMDAPLGQFLNQGYAQGSAGKPSNNAVAAVTVLQNKSVAFSKQASVAQATVIGTPITYTYRLTNNGNVTLTAPYSITDNMIPNISCAGAPSSLPPTTGVATCTATYSIVQADLDAGSIVNTAYAIATFSGQPVISSPATATVLTYVGSRLGLIKTANPTTYSSLGQTISYTYTLKNTGSVNLISPYSVTDNLVAGIDCSGAASPLLPSKTTTCSSGTYLIGVSDMARDSVTNRASATATDSSTGLPITSVPSPSTATITRFLCDRTHLTHLNPTPIGDSADAIWTVVNNTGLQLHINSITIGWSSGPPYLTQVFLNGNPIWNGLSPSAGGFALPLPTAGYWLLPTGNTPVELQYTGTASSIHIVLTFNEAGCPQVDSNVPPG